MNEELILATKREIAKKAYDLLSFKVNEHELEAIIRDAIHKASLCPRCDREEIERLTMLDFPPAQPQTQEDNN